uniref:GmrSD restriction endonucleases N-terminal domain-containing protein n=1 Tax=Psilocybe cubensis TaxID=181762 RepID=A0A8H7XP35_PSICU
MPPMEFSITFDEEELTELSSDEEDDAPMSLPTPKSAPPRPVITTEPIAPVVPVRAKSTRPTTQKATEDSRARNNKSPTVVPPLKVEWLKNGPESLDLEADYQRGIVWSDVKQVGLIDSIFTNFFIPPLVFSVTYHPDGSESRVCIDGKQRLTSILRFMLGEIHFWDRHQQKRVFYRSAPGKRRKVLDDKIRKTFDQKQLMCYEYESVTPEQEREIFHRVQLGMALGPADRLPAINGSYADLVRALRLKMESTEGFSHFSNESRGKDFQALAQIVYMIEEGLTKKTCDATTKYLEIFLAKQGVDTRALEAKVHSAIDLFVRILQDPDLSLPLLEYPMCSMEFVMTVYLVHLHRSFSLEHLSVAIRFMRHHWFTALTKKLFTKADTKAFLHLANFVKTITKTKVMDWANHTQPVLVHPKGTNKRGRAKTAEDNESVLMTKTPGRKRKVEDDDEDEDSDDECQKISRPRKKLTTTVKKQGTVTPASTPAPTPAPDADKLKMKIEKAISSTRKAKTTIKRVSPTKRKSVPVPTAFAAKPSRSGSVLNQVAKPSIKPGQRSVSASTPQPCDPFGPLDFSPSVSRASSTTSTSRLPPAAGDAAPSAGVKPPISVAQTATTAPATPIAPTTPTVPIVPTAPTAPINTPVAFGGIATPRASPMTYETQIVSASAGLASPPPSSASSSAMDDGHRLAPLRRAQAADRLGNRGSFSDSASSSMPPLSELLGRRQSSDSSGSSIPMSGSSGSTLPGKRSFSAPNATTNGDAAPAQVVSTSTPTNSMSGPEMEAYLLCQQRPVNNNIHSHANGVPKHPQAAPQSPPSDPRLRVQVQRESSSVVKTSTESRLPTPPQSGQSPQVSQEQLFARPTHTHEQMTTATAAAGISPSARVWPGQTGPQHPYPVPGDRNNR